MRAISRYSSSVKKTVRRGGPGFSGPSDRQGERPSLGAGTQPAYQILKLAVCAENVDLDQDEQDDAAPEVGPQNIAGPVRTRPHPLEARQNDEREAGPLHPSPYPRIGY